jgi:hypothetical protein
MKKKIKYLVIFTSIVTLSSIFYIIDISSKNKKNLMNNLELCLTTEWEKGKILPDGTSYNIEEDELPAKIRCVKKYTKEIKSITDIEKNVKNLVNAANSTKRFNYLCHDFLHEIGTFAYSSFREESLIVGLDSCGWGYYHGAMLMSLSGNSDYNNIEEKIENLKKFCYRLSHEPDNNKVEKDKLDGGFNIYTDVSGEDTAEFAKPYNIEYPKFTFCGHGIGHAIGESFNELSEMANFCSLLYNIKLDPGYEDMQRGVETELKGIGVELNDIMDIGTKIDEECYSGAMNSIMVRNVFRKENVAFKGMVDSTFEKIENIIPQCREIEKINARLISNCIRYAIAYSNKIKTDDAKLYCKDLQENESNRFIINGCYAGLGHKESNDLFTKNEVDLENNNKESILRRKGQDITEKLVNACQDEIEGYCTERFTLETLQLLRDSESMLKICNGIYNEKHRGICRKAVLVMGDIQEK